MFRVNASSIEQVIVSLLAERGETLALAESCTGGNIAHRITNVPGASRVFPGGVVAYSNAVKERILGVSAATLAAHGAVSEAVAREMAAGARERFSADYAMAVTGIAGPGGGTEEKPVGTVFIAVASASAVEVRRFLFVTDRESFKQQTASQGLELLKAALLPERGLQPASASE